MLEFAKSEFHLAQKNSEGVSAYEVLKSVERQTGRTPYELANRKTCPLELSTLWKDFTRLCETSHSFGGSCISYQEILCYSVLFDRPFCAWEIEVIRSLDRIRSDAAEEQRKINAEAASSGPQAAKFNK